MLTNMEVMGKEERRAKKIEEENICDYLSNNVMTSTLTSTIHIAVAILFNDIIDI
jgi:hypothetical protein